MSYIQIMKYCIAECNDKIMWLTATWMELADKWSESKELTYLLSYLPVAYKITRWVNGDI